jgi:hypothetical protein
MTDSSIKSFINYSTVLQSDYVIISGNIADIPLIMRRYFCSNKEN